MKNKKKRYKILAIPEYAVLELFINQIKNISIKGIPKFLKIAVIEGLPKDAVINHVYYSHERMCFMFVLESKKFPVINEACILEEIKVNYKIVQIKLEEARGKNE